MDHVVFLDSEAKELENLVCGNKSMIIRGASERKVPYGKVNKGDNLYFINDNGEKKIRAKGVVSFVLNTEELSVDESFETIIRHQEKLQLPDKQFDKVAGKEFLVFIGLTDISEVGLFPIGKTNFTSTDDWIPVGKIENLVDKARVE